MSFSVSILATGSELLDGRVVDTNSNFVAGILAQRGLRLKRVLVVDDDREELLAGLRDLCSVSELVITSGGLGPTTDDLTREIVAEFCGVGVVESPQARKHVEEFYLKRARVLEPTNLKQALLPQGATMIHNELGTAPGFIARTGEGRVICSLSGVPREFKQMFVDTVVPIITEKTKDARPIHRATFKTFGLPESVVGRLVAGCGLPGDITVSYRAAFPEVHVVLKTARPENLPDASRRVESALGSEVIFSREAERDFFQELQRLCEKRHITVATAESCTGGMIAECLTRTPGSSAVFLGGVVSYNNSVKQALLNVPQEIIAKHGAVSAEVVRIMAREARSRIGATFGVAVSGVAGPDGGSAEKPVGTFFVGVSGPQGAREVRCFYPGERATVRMYATYVALDLIRRELEAFPIPDGYPLVSRQ